MGESRGMISRWQQLCLGFLALLSPIIRLLPQQSAEYAGGSVWASALLGALPVALLYLLMARFLKNAEPDQSFGELFIKILGKTAGKLLLLIFALWLIFYAGFSLKSGAARYISTAYAHADSSFFIVVLLLLSLMAALGRFRALGRASEVFFPLMILVLALVFGFSFSDVQTEYLTLPVPRESAGLLLGAVPVANILGLSVFFGFLEGRVEKQGRLKRFLALWLTVMTAVVLLLCVTTVGSLGAELTSRLEYPFFDMVRNISLFNFLERLESAVMALWVITDFVFCSTLLFIVSDILRLIFGLSGGEPPKTLLSMKNGRWIILLCALLTGLCALAAMPDGQGFAALSDNIVPLVNLGFTFLLLPAVALVGLLRRRI